MEETNNSEITAKIKESVAAEKAATGRYLSVDLPTDEIKRRGRNFAALALEDFGCEILAIGWHCPAGSIDIVAKDEDTIIFADVETIPNRDGKFPAEDLGPGKRAEFESIALAFLSSFAPKESIVFRYDNMGIVIMGPDFMSMKHHVNALGLATAG